MSVFNDQQKGDFVEFEMRVQNAQRRILQRMFMSEVESKKMLEQALERAMVTIDVPGLVAKEAERAVMDGIQAYFSYGEGHRIIRDATHKALNEALPKIFEKKEA